MFYYLPERVYDTVKTNKKLAELEAEFTELNKNAFDYSPDVVEELYRIGFRMQREVSRCMRKQKPEVEREFKIILSYTNKERLLEFLETETDPENIMYLHKELVNFPEIGVKRQKNAYIYEYNKLTRQQKIKLSPMLHATYLAYMGENVVENATGLTDAVNKLRNMKDDLRRIPVELFPEKHDKMLAYTFIEMVNVAYQFHRYNASNQEVLDMLTLVMDMSKWNEKVYDDVWIGNFNLTELIYNVLFDYGYRNDEKGLKFITNVLVTYLVSAMTNIQTTIKALTSNDKEYRMNYLALVGSCIRLLEQIDEEAVKEQILPVMPVVFNSNISSYNDIDKSETPISDFMGLQVNYEPQLINTVTAEIELKMTSDYKLLQDNL